MPDSHIRSTNPTISRFEPLLTSYAKSRGVSRTSGEMTAVERALARTLDRARGQTYPDRVLVALAGVEAGGELDAFARLLLLSDDHPDGHKDHIMNAMKEDRREFAFEHSAEWLSMGTPWWRRLNPWRQREEEFTPKSAEALLRTLYQKYFSPEAPYEPPPPLDAA